MVSILAMASIGSAETPLNYGEALQKAIMFYEFQRSGKLPVDKRDNWRGDSGLIDGADAGIDLTGGWYDAGDHVKFNLPMSYSAAMLAWSVYEDKDAYVASGQLDYILAQIRWANDYFIKCHTAPNEYYYQVGNGNLDHAWWGPAEVMQMARPSYKVTLNAGGSTVVAETAASLATAALVFKTIDPTYAAKCLKHAKELYSFAETTKSDAGYTAASGFYNSWSGFYDELSWAGAWLYLATQDQTYLDKAEEYAKNWGTEPQTTTVGYKWAHCWDDVHNGAAVLLARLTDKEIYKKATEMHLDYWTTGVNGLKISYTTKGLAWLSRWGSLRYATTTAFLADIYAAWSGCPTSKATIYKNFAKQQADYALGSSGRSFVVGYGVNPPQHPHHRTAHSSWADSLSNPATHRHVLYGALVGGPDAANDSSYEDDISNYITNEVACDYNAGFVGILARMYNQHGGTPIANFKAIETVTNDELYVEAGLNASSTNFVEIKAIMNNRSGWPARVGDKLSFKYFINLSEIIQAGYTAADIVVSSSYNQGAVFSQVLPWDVANHIYYVNVDFTGTKIYPGGMSAHRKEIQLRMAAPMGVTWNNANDFSYRDLVGTGGGSVVKTKNIPVYDDGVKVFGNEERTIPAPVVRITEPIQDQLFELPSAQNPIDIKANATITEGSITKVEFYVNNELKVTDNTAPYAIKWYPTGGTQNSNGIEYFTIKAKAYADNDTITTSSEVKIKVKLPVIEPPAVVITSPKENEYFEYPSVTQPINLKANATSSNGAISKVEFFINDNKIGEDNIAPYSINWYPEGFTQNQNGLETYRLTVKATDEDQNVGTSSVVSFVAKIPVDPNALRRIKVQMYNGSTNDTTNSISPKIKVINDGNTSINLANLKIRYYYTIDGEKVQNYWSDNAAIVGTGKYASLSGINAKFVKLESAKLKADYYLELSFPANAGMLEAGQTLEMQNRFAKGDWSNYTQTNDYSFNATANSYQDSTTVTVYLDGSLISGIEP